MWTYCCPGDKRCINATCMSNRHTVCEHCEVPVCTDCFTVVEKPLDIFDGMYPQPPPRVLANNMMISYAPRSMYENPMTVLERVCSRVWHHLDDSFFDGSKVWTSITYNSANARHSSCSTRACNKSFNAMAEYLVWVTKTRKKRRKIGSSWSAPIGWWSTIPGASASEMKRFCAGKTSSQIYSPGCRAARSSGLPHWRHEETRAQRLSSCRHEQGPCESQGHVTREWPARHYLPAFGKPASVPLPGA